MVKVTSQGDKSCFPAQEGEVVLMVQESEDGITAVEALEVGEEPSEDSENEEEAHKTEVSSQEELVAALEAAEDGAKIKLTEDLDIGSSYITIDKSAEIDLGGKSISSSSVAFYVDGGELTLSNGSVSATSDSIQVRNGGKLIIDGADITSTGKNAVSAVESEVTVEDGNIQSQEAGIAGFKDSTIIINGGTITGIDNCPIMGNGSKAGAKNDGTNMNVVMNGGKLVAHIQSSGYIACGVYVPNSGSFTMNGGEIISDGAGLVQRGGTVNLNGGSIQANGATGVSGKVGDSRVVVGPYAVCFDYNSKYPACDSMELNIESGIQLQGTDGELQTILPEISDSFTEEKKEEVLAKIHDNRGE